MESRWLIVQSDMYANMSYLVRIATGLPVFGSLTGSARKCIWRNSSNTFGS